MKIVKIVGKIFEAANKYKDKDTSIENLSSIINKFPRENRGIGYYFNCILDEESQILVSQSADKLEVVLCQELQKDLQENERQTIHYTLRKIKDLKKNLPVLVS